MRLSSNVKVVLAALTLAGFSAPRAAEACGGTFCDTGPRPMPVPQTGENILFVMESGMVEAHIQIQYKGEAAKFSWVLPIQAPAMPPPDIKVGSQALFDKLLAATVPMYSTTTQFDNCGPVTSSSAFTGATGTGSSGGGGGGGPGGPPVVILQKPVGAFEIAVLSGGTTMQVVDWLTTNGYEVPTNASALLDGYVTNQFLFVAVKLTGGAGIDEIHPLVVRYPGNKPCVPIKLTAVAATEDMGIRTFFLGNKRVVPSNYKHVIPNLVKFDWFNAGTSYQNLVSRAIDSPVANGKAFVTEYAGQKAIVPAQPIASSSWNAAPFETAAAVGVVQVLQNQMLMNCFGNMCNYNHPLLLPILRQYLPAPKMIMVNGNTIVDPVAIEGYFYSCTPCYMNQVDMAKWSGTAFAKDLAERIIDPSRHADAVLGAWPYLTRMFTTISPAEMDLDPEFMERDGLGDVGLIRLNAIQRVTCQSRAGMVLPDGRDVALPSQGTWPGFSNAMPWAEKIDEIQAATVVHLVDNTATIDAQLKSWNDAQSWPPPTTTGPTPTSGPGTGPGGPGTGGSSGQGGAGGANSANPIIVNNGSCGCRSMGSASGPGWAFALAALAGLVGLVRRRRDG